MKMDIAGAVLLDLKKRKKGAVMIGKGKPADDAEPSKGAQLLEAIKAEDADAIDRILGFSEEEAEE